MKLRVRALARTCHLRARPALHAGNTTSDKFDRGLEGLRCLQAEQSTCQADARGATQSSRVVDSSGGRC
jgi:hypothetical protein